LRTSKEVGERQKSYERSALDIMIGKKGVGRGGGGRGVGRKIHSVKAFAYQKKDSRTGQN